MKPSVDIITTAHNRIDHLKCTLPHFFNQKYDGEYLVTCVDYGSSDGTQEYLCKVNNPKLQVVTVPYKKIFTRSHALNIGIKYTNNTIIIFADIDCIYPTFFVDKMINAHGNADNKIIYGHGRYELTKEQYMQLKRAKLDLSTDHKKRNIATLLNNCTNKKFMLGAYQSICRHRVMAINGFNEKFVYAGWEEVELHRRLANLGCKGGFAEDVFALHLPHTPWNRHKGRENEKMADAAFNPEYPAVQNVDINWGEVR
jgi:glycosyltransferase involved in cell wall biosynthesis